MNRESVYGKAGVVIEVSQGVGYSTVKSRGAVEVASPQNKATRTKRTKPDNKAMSAS